VFSLSAYVFHPGLYGELQGGCLTMVYQPFRPKSRAGDNLTFQIERRNRQRIRPPLRFVGWAKLALETPGTSLSADAKHCRN